MYYLKISDDKKVANYLPGQLDPSGKLIDEKINVDISKCANNDDWKAGRLISVSSKLFSKTVLTSCKLYKTLTVNKLINTNRYKPTSTTIDFNYLDDAPTSSEYGFYINSEKWKLLKRNVANKINTMIIGPTGCGKTSIVKILSEKLNIPMYIIDCGAITDPISSLLGVHRIKDGHSIFDYAKFTQIIQKPCIILLDELSRAGMGSNNILFSCLDDRRELNIEIAGCDDTRTIKVDPGVTFIATANMGFSYTDTRILDAALVDRFFPIELSEIPEDEEISVLVKRSGIDKQSAVTITHVANTVRSLFSKGDLSRSISIRETIMIANLKKDGWTIGSALQTVMLPLFEGTNSTGERSKVYKSIASC